MISQIFILSLRGEVIVFEDFRYDCTGSTPEKFFGFVKEIKGNSLEPVVERDGIKYFYIIRDNLYFVATSAGLTGIMVAGMAFHITVLEILKRFYVLCKDFCGVVSEASMRANVMLVHEILGQLLDNGYVQISTADKLKPFIMSEPERFPMQMDSLFSSLAEPKHLLPSTASNKPIARSRAEQEKKENEIFVDVVEKLIVIVNADGTVSRSEISGEVQMKCFVIGQPSLKIGLNEGLVISHDEDTGFGAAAHISDCRFHERISLAEFTSKRILLLQPPEGQFTVMNYHVAKDLPNALPFNLFYTVDSIAESEDLEVTLRLRCNIPSNTEAIKVSSHFPVPKSTTSFMQKCNGPLQTARFDGKEKKIIWNIKKLPGGTEATVKLRLIHGNTHQSSRMELGPLVLVDFEISSYVCSNLQIRFLKLLSQDSSTRPRLWVRYITVSNSYLFKLHA